VRVTGSEPESSTVLSSFALLSVKLPVMATLPSVIVVCTAGAEYSTPSSTMAIWPFVGASSVVTSEKNLGALGVERDIDLIGSHGGGRGGHGAGLDVGAVHEGGVGALLERHVVSTGRDLRESLGIADGPRASRTRGGPSGRWSRPSRRRSWPQESAREWRV